MVVFRARSERNALTRYSRKITFAAAVTLLGASVGATPIVDYRFNETGNSALSIGSDTASVYFTNSAGQLTDLHGAPGSGVTGGLGLPGSATDRAFDNTASTGMGSAGVGGMAAMLADDDAIDGMTSFTMSGWFKTQDASLPGNYRLFKNTAGSNTTAGYHMIGGNAAGEIRLKTDSTERTIASVAAPGVWIFLAVTYDGKQTKNNFRLYEGFRNAAEAPSGNPAVVFIDGKTLNEGPSDQDSGILQLGNENGVDFQYNRPFDGWLDNMRIDCSMTDSSGALSLDVLEARRAGDVPEPVAAGLMLLFAPALAIRRRRSFSA